jgi:hypothetical protein
VWEQGVIEGVIWEAPDAIPPLEHCVKYRLVYIVNGVRVVGYDNERGKGDQNHTRDSEAHQPKFGRSTKKDTKRFNK